MGMLGRRVAGFLLLLFLLLLAQALRDLTVFGPLLALGGAALFLYTADRLSGWTKTGGLTTLGLRIHAGWGGHLVLGALVGFTIQGLSFLLHYLGGNLTILGPHPDGLLQPLLGAIISATIVGLGEELLFRGFLFAALPSRWSTSTRIGLTALIFMSLHVQVLFTLSGPSMLTTPLYLTLAGLLFGMIYARLSSLWLPVGLHIAWDMGFWLLNPAGRSHSYYLLRTSLTPAGAALDPWLDPLWVLVAIALLLPIVWRLGRSPYRLPLRPGQDLS